MHDTRPDICFIMCDQLRHDWIGALGASHVRTPNIDRIYARGLAFTQCATTSPVCAPARIGLATGKRPHRLGALDNHAFLPRSCTTHYQHFRDHGYRVGCVGKLDLGKPDGQNGSEGRRPMCYSWGFTDPLECEGKLHAGRGDPANGPYTHWLAENHPDLYAAFIADYHMRRGKGADGHLHDSVLPFGMCEDDFIGDRAVALLESMTAEFPWYAFISFVGPHNPFDPAPEFAERWRDAPMPDAIPWEPEGRPPRYACKVTSDPSRILDARRQYTAYLEQIDHHIGRILDAIEARDSGRDTIIVFSADHGEMLGDHGRYTKSCQYEASLRIPLAIAGPGISPGTSEALVELSDVNPTLSDLAGLPAQADLDARSIKPVLTGQTREHRSHTVATHRGQHCIRNREWKYIRGDDMEHELYHLARDPDERHNCLAEHPDIGSDFEQRFVAAWTEGGCLR